VALISVEKSNECVLATKCIGAFKIEWRWW
jgi:hypothetical protein